MIGRSTMAFRTVRSGLPVVIAVDEDDEVGRSGSGHRPEGDFMRCIRGMKIGLLLACLTVFSAGCASLSPKFGVLPSIARHRAESQYQTARQAEQRGQYAKARELYAALQRQSPKTPAYAHRMGVVCVQLKDYATAEKYFDHARSLDARNPALLADMGYSAYLQRDYAGAEALLNESVELSSGDPRAVNNLAMAIAHQGRYEECLAVFRRVNSETQSLLNVAAIQSQRGDPETAMATYRQILSNEPANKLASRALHELNAARPRQLAAPMPGDDRETALANAQESPLTDQPDSARKPAIQDGGDESKSQAPFPPTPPLVITSADEPASPSDGFESPIITPDDGHWANTPVPPKPVDEESIASDGNGYELPKTADPPGELAVDETEPEVVPEEAPPAEAKVAQQATPDADELSKVFEGDDNAPESPMKDSEELTGLEWAQEDLARDKAAVDAGTKAAVPSGDFLRGFCPVALRDERRLAQVSDEFSTDYQGQVHRFCSAAARDQFVEHPDWYVPAAGGLDVIEVKRGQAGTPGSLDYACWFRHRLHMFRSAENLAAFRAAPRDFVARP